MADQEFLASFGVEIDESGLDKLQKALTQNRTLAEELASAFDSARSAVGEFFKQLSASTLPSGELSPYQRLMEMSEKGISFSMDLDTTDADGTLHAFLENAQQFFDSTPLPLTADESPLVTVADETLFMLQALYGETLLPLVADASNVISAGQDALAQLQSMFASANLTVNARVNIQGGFGSLGGLAGLKAAAGGRFSSPSQVQIAEDGDPEYVIPVKKESMAVPLLRQLFGELSASARETLKEGLGWGTGAGQNDAFAGLPDLRASAPAAAVPVIHQTSNASVQAPVSINVTASGTDPEAVGKSIYDVTERYLLRTLEQASVLQHG